MPPRKEPAVHKPSTIAISSGTMFRIIIIALVSIFLFLIRDIVAMTLVAAFLAALIDPFADAFTRVNIPRALAVMVVYLVGASCFAIVALLIVPPLLTELSELATVFAPLWSGSNSWLQADAFLAGSWSTDMSSIISTIQRSGVVGAFPRIAEFGTSAIDGVFRLFIVLILAFYFIVEKNSMIRGIGIIAPSEYQPFVMHLALKARERMGIWLRGQLALMVSIFILIYPALLLLGIPYALVLALFAGLLEIIPFVGPMVSAVPAILLAFSISPFHALLTACVYLVIQQVEGNILVPKIMQKVAGVNPIVSVLAVLIGWRVGGIVGAVLSIPIAMVCSVFVTEIFNRHES